MSSFVGSFQYNVTTCHEDSNFYRGLNYFKNTDYQEAMTFFKLAKKERNGTTPAYVFLAVMYFVGLGVARNPKKAVYYINRIHGQYGCRVANYILGLMYKNGDYVEKDFQEAVAQFAATSKYEWANTHIAEIYQILSAVGKEGSIDWHGDVRRMSKNKAQASGTEADMQLLFTLVRNYEENDYMYDLKKSAVFYQQPFKYISQKLCELGSKLMCFRHSLTLNKTF